MFTKIVQLRCNYGYLELDDFLHLVSIKMTPCVLSLSHDDCCGAIQYIMTTNSCASVIDSPYAFVPVHTLYIHYYLACLVRCYHAIPCKQVCRISIMQQSWRTEIGSTVLHVSL